MSTSLSALFTRRRRSALLKFSVVLTFVVTLILWKQSGSKTRSTFNGGDGFSNFIPMRDSGNVLEEPEKLIRSVDDEEKARKEAESENMDEFLIPVLRDYKYVEVDLNPTRDMESNDYDAEITEDEARVVRDLGEGGIKATVPMYQEAVAAEILKKEAFNRLLSEMISVNRTVPDTREKSCKYVEYDNDLPDASIVIIYTNEAYSSLVRTIHSVINKSPPHLMREIILVDDYSDKRELKGKLERYLARKFPQGKVRLVKLLKRSGLIRARMIGAHLAVGKTIVFLDAHCECVDDWLQPMLQRIKDERTAVVCPIIDVIDEKSMEYYHGNGEFFQIGGFSWSGHFTWINIPDYEAKRKIHHYSPTRTPTMAGGLFAIDRKYFWEIGSYDSDMQLWGGENLEMSFRVWQCGGSVEIIPCSRVGHIFRSFHPYSFPGNVDSHGLNTARLVEVWLDDYKDYFYQHRPELKTAKFGDVSKRLEFKKRMNCKSFGWYLDKVFKEKFRMEKSSSHVGQVKNKATNQCLDNMQHSDSSEYQLDVYPCHPQLYPSQTFFLSFEGELRRENECAAVRSDKYRVDMVPCENSAPEDKWDYEGSALRHRGSDKCLSVATTSGKGDLTVEPCVAGSPSQKWQFPKQSQD